MGRGLRGLDLGSGILLYRDIKEGGGLGVQGRDRGRARRIELELGRVRVLILCSYYPYIGFIIDLLLGCLYLYIDLFFIGGESGVSPTGPLGLGLDPGLGLFTGRGGVDQVGSF